MLWVIIVLAFTISTLLTWRLTSPSSHFYVLDNPNERSLHASPVPRSGGLAILIAVFASAVIQILRYGQFHDIFIWIGPGLFLLSAVSYVDDRHHVPVTYRLIVQILSVSLLLAGGLSLHSDFIPGIEWTAPAWIGIPVTMMFAIWMINLYNFMDGIDGFAGGMAICGFGVFSVFGWMAGEEVFAITCASIASAATGFLCFNFPPARIFMGDIGSSILGFLAASLSLWGVKENIFPFWIAILVFSPFIADATVTLMRRLWRREKVWHAHKNHYYQLLTQAGFGHRKTVLIEYIIMSGCAVVALWAFHLPDPAQIAVLLGCVIFYTLFFFWAARVTSRCIPGNTKNEAG